MTEMNMLNKLKYHLKNTPLVKLKEEWKAVEKYANIGPTVESFITASINRKKR